MIGRLNDSRDIGVDNEQMLYIAKRCKGGGRC